MNTNFDQTSTSYLAEHGTLPHIVNDKLRGSLGAHIYLWIISIHNNATRIKSNFFLAFHLFLCATPTFDKFENNPITKRSRFD